MRRNWSRRQDLRARVAPRTLVSRLPRKESGASERNFDIDVSHLDFRLAQSHLSQGFTLWVFLFREVATADREWSRRQTWKKTNRSELER
jgi:hypothetical protein